MPLGIGGFTYADLYDPARLGDLLEAFDLWFLATAPEARSQFELYRSCKGDGMTPLQQSEALLAAAPFVGRFVGKLFGVEAELERFRESVRANDPLWRFRKDFVKKRVLRADAGRGWTRGTESARDVARASLQSMSAAPIGGTTDEESTLASALLPLLEVDDVARKAAKAGGAQWTDELRARARAVRGAVRSVATDACEGEDDAALGRAVAFALDAIEAWLATGGATSTTRSGAGRRCACRRRSTTRTSSSSSVPTRRCPSSSSVRDHERRERDGFSLTDRRMSARAGRAGDRLLPLLPRPRQGLVRRRACRDTKTRRVQEEPARRRARRLPARREDQRDARRCGSDGDALARARASSASTTRCARAPVTASATTA